MGKISEIFNFDNIGRKIKNLAKWSCWITILLIWVAAPIAFIVLVSDDWTAYLCWIPLVGAIIAPIFVWIGSWAMYAFGEFVEKTADNENNTRLILKKLNKKTDEGEIAPPHKTSSVPPKTNESPKDKERISIINKNNSTAPYWCGKCGHEGPYNGNCPNCNSSLKKYNVK